MLRRKDYWECESAGALKMVEGRGRAGPFVNLISEPGREPPEGPASVAGRIGPSSLASGSFRLDWALAPFSQAGRVFVLIWKCGCRGAECSREAHSGPSPTPFP